MSSSSRMRDSSSPETVKEKNGVLLTSTCRVNVSAWVGLEGTANRWVPQESLQELVRAAGNALL